MPGLFGIISRNSFARARALEEMRGSMLHDKFYSSGTWSNNRLGLGVGWVCHKNSFADCLPIWNETRDVCLIFSGGEFSESSQIENLRARGHSFTDGDASYLVHWYEEAGEAFLEKLNGWFSGVLVDLRLGRVLLFNDRYGLNRVYVHEQADTTWFASEAKALLNVLPQTRELDQRGVAERFSCGCVLQNRTIFSGVTLLPPASKWTFRAGAVPQRETYFAPETWESQPQLRAPEFYQQLRETFPRVLSRYLRCRDQIAMSLTGGLDSRMIMACSGRDPGALPCYTFGGSYRDCADVALARKIAEACRQSHQVIPVDGDFLARFPQLAAKTIQLSDGAMDVSGAVELYVNRIAREIAPVRLTGNYGSEILRSSVAFKPGSFEEELYEPEFARLIWAADETYAEEARGHRLSFIAFKQVPWHHYSRLAIEQSQLTVRAPYLDNDLVRLAYQAPADLSCSKETCLRLIAEVHPSLTRIPTDRGVSFPNVSVLAAVRHLFSEFTVKAEYAFDTGMPHWLARIDQLFAPLRMDRMFLGRHKFYHFRVWYRGQLSQYLQEVLLDPKTRGRSPLRGGCLEKLVGDHVSGKRNYTTALHQALTFELIHRELLEPKPNALT